MKRYLRATVVDSFYVISTPISKHAAAAQHTGVYVLDLAMPMPINNQHQLLPSFHRPSCREKLNHPSNTSLVNHVLDKGARQPQITDTSLHRAQSLLELLAVSPLVGLAVDHERLIPAPHVVHELAILLLAWVELLELVALVVWGDVESWKSLLATDQEGALDHGVVGDAEHGAAPEEVLARRLKTGEEAADEVGSHEGHGELVVVLVVHLPQAVLIKLAVLPEPWQSDLARLLVGVLALPIELLAYLNIY
jgi:hypothetical protein